MLGILLIDKPSGGTSHDAVDRVRKIFETRRVGHAGTLDPLATGLLVVAVGAATRFLQYLPLEPKEYEGVIQFGLTSTTYDGEGELSEPGPIPADLSERLAEILPGFHGLQSQVPPMYSAVKVAGKPLYAYARKGEEALRTPRNIFIESFDLTLEAEGCARFRLVCSGGTYVRTLAHDLGKTVGCGAYLAQLRRTRAGAFRVEDSVSLESASAASLIPLDRALRPMPMRTLSGAEVEDVRQGRRIAAAGEYESRWVGLLNPEGAIVGVAAVVGAELQPECVIPKEAAGG